MKTAAVIPAYNEERNVADVINEIRNIVNFVIVVDDGSTDGTCKVIQEVMNKEISDSVFLLKHRANLGKGAALKTGFLAAEKLGAEIVVTVDGDGQHPIRHVPEMIKKLEEDNLDILFSARQGGDLIPFVRKAGNSVLNWAARRFFGLKLNDLWCGLRIIRMSIFPKISWSSADYSGEVQMALKAAKAGVKYGEHMIPAVYSDKFKGVTIIDGIKLLALMVFWRIKL